MSKVSNRTAWLALSGASRGAHVISLPPGPASTAFRAVGVGSEYSLPLAAIFSEKRCCSGRSIFSSGSFSRRHGVYRRPEVGDVAENQRIHLTPKPCASGHISLHEPLLQQPAKPDAEYYGSIELCLS